LADRNRTEFYRLLQRHGLSPEPFRAENQPDEEQTRSPSRRPA